jgi:protein phosphatase
VLRAYGVTDPGRVRPANEDHFAIEPRLGLCVIADGMGGHNAGEVAARLAVDAVVDFVTAALSDERPGQDDTQPFGVDPALTEGGNLLRTAIHLANVQILESASSAHQYAGMGTTVVAALILGDRLSVAHVGDSRLYLFASDRLRQLTSDDSWVATVLAQNPKTDPVVLKHHPMRNALTNVVGARPRLDVHVVEETLKGGERLLLTTDGVHGVLDERYLERVLLETSDLAEVPGEIVKAALTRGSRDNCTAVAAVYST